MAVFFNAMKVSDYDTWIVRVENEYLVAVAYVDTGMCRLSGSPYEALRFQDGADASMVARRAGGNAIRFNPITGRVG